MKGDVKHINWTGTLTNERVLQSLIGAFPCNYGHDSKK